MPQPRRFLVVTLVLALALPVLSAVAQTDATDAANQPAAPGASAETRVPVPDAKAVAASRKQVSDVFKEDFGKAKLPEQKSALAAKLLETAAGGGTSGADHYAMLKLASELAAQAGDLNGAVQAAEAISAAYVVDDAALTLDAYEQVVKQYKKPADFLDAARAVTAWADGGTMASRFAARRRAAELGALWARRGGDTAMAMQLSTRGRELAEAEQTSADAKTAEAVIQINPAHPAANLAVARYHAFVLGDWKTGLPYLLRAAGDPLQPLAQRETEATPGDLAALADAWWQAGESQKPLAQRAVRAHAAELYRQALPTLAGLAKIKVEKRLAEIGAAAPGASGSAPSGASAGTPPVTATRVKEGILPPQKTSVRAVAFSPDGATLVTTDDNVIRFWSPANGSSKGELTGHTARVYTLAFSGDGRTLASSGADKTVRLWDPKSGKATATLDVEHTNGVMAIGLSRDGAAMFTAGGENIRFFDLPKTSSAKPTERAAVTLPSAGGGTFIRAAAMAPDGSAAVISIREPMGGTGVKVFAAGDDKARLKIDGHEALAWSPNGKLIAGGGCGDSHTLMKIFDAATGSVLIELPAGHSKVIRCVAFSPDSTLLATGSEDKTVKLWDLRAKKAIASYEGHTGTVLCVAFAPDGRSLATGSEDKTVRLWVRGSGK